MKIQSLYGEFNKTGFVVDQLAVGRAVRPRECPLRELRL